MKKNILFLFFLLKVFNAWSQPLIPVEFTFSAKKISVNTYEVHITATLENNWHTYSQTTPSGGPVPTVIMFVKNPLVELVGKPKEIGKLEQHYEKIFWVDVKQFSDKVDFVQTVKIKKPIKTNISGTIEFMVCNDKECLPPTTNKFSIALQ